MTFQDLYACMYICTGVFITVNIAGKLHRLQITEIRRIHIEHLTANIKTN